MRRDRGLENLSSTRPRYIDLADRALYIDAIAHCEAVKDFVSREILVDIQSDTGEHIDYLETRIDLIQRMGERNYLQTAAGPIES